ncbi:MAG: hypothetical protein KDA21_09450, partial [Phycisphaerales bacterium]|nr:hypothetical protein [Phycisphaerales bacterium]
VDPDSVEFVNIAPEAKIASLQSGVIDATTHFYNVHYIYERIFGDDMGFVALRDIGFNPYGNAFIVNGDLALTQNGSSVNADAGHIRVNGGATGLDDASLTATGAGADVRITGAASFDDRLTVEAGNSATFGSSVRIGDDAQVTATAGNAIFLGSVDAQAGDTGSLTVSAAAGNVDFVGDVGQSDALTSLTSTAMTTQVRNVRTTGNQQYNSNLTVEGNNLATSTVISSTGNIEVTGQTTAANEAGGNPAVGVVIEASNGQVHLVGLVDGALLDQNVLELNGNSVVLDSDVGFAILPRLACLSINADVASVQSVFTQGTQDYGSVGMLTVNGPLLRSFGSSTLCPVGSLTFNNIILAGNTNIVSGGMVGDDITVNGTINGPFQLSMFANDADVLLCGTIGGFTPLAGLGAFGENVTIFDVGTAASAGVTGALTVTAGTDINFKGNNYRANNQIWTAGSLFNQELAGGTKTFIADTGNVFFAGVGSTILRDGLVMSVNSLAGDVVFQGRIFGDTTTAATETLNLLALDRIDLFGNVGDNAADGFAVPLAEAGRLGVLSASAGNVTRIQDVRTTGIQVYNATTGGTLLIEGSRLDASGASIMVGSLATPAPTLLANDVTVTTGGLAGQDVLFSGTIDSDGGGNRNLVVNSGAATIFFGNDIGRAGGLAASRLASLTATGSQITLGGDVLVTGFVLISGNSILDDLDDDRVIVHSNGGALTFNGSVESPNGDGFELVTSGGTVTLNGDLGTNNALGFLHADVNAGLINFGGDVRTNGTAIGIGADGVFHGETVRADGASLLTDADGRVLMQGSGGDITFTGAIDSFTGAGLELLRAGDETAFGGDIGGTSALAFFGADVDNGNVTFNGDITTNGAAINGNEDSETIRVDGAVQLADTDGRVVVEGNGGDITFTSTVDSAAGNGLEVISDGGAATFGGDLGSGNALAFLNVDTNGASDGSVSLGGNVTTSGAEIGAGADGDAHTESVRIDGGTTLAADVTVTSSNGDVLFNDTIDGGNALVVDSGSGETTLQGAVGGGNELVSLDVTASQININGGEVSTSGDQSYQGSTVLGANTVMNGANATFDGTLDSDGTARDLTVNVDGATLFGDDVGSGSALADLVTDAPGTTAFGGDVSAANMTFNDNATANTDLALNGTTSVTFNDTFSGGGNSVTVNSPTTTFNGRVTNMDVLTTDADGTTFIGTDLVSGESLLFNDNVVLATNIPGNSVTFDGDTTVVFGQTVNGSMINDLMVTSPVNVFTGIVFGVDDLMVDGLARVGSDVNARTIRFFDTVQLTGNSVMGSFAPGFAGAVANQSVTFDGQVQGGMLGGGDRTDLTVNSPATFFNAGAAGLGHLATDAAGTTTIADDIETFEGATFGDAVAVADSLTIADRGQGNIIFASTLDSVGGVHNLILQVAQDAAFDINSPAAPFIGFGGNVGGNGAFNLLKLGNDFNDIPVTATLVAAPFAADGTIDMNRLDGYEIEFTANTIDMGVHQKLSVLGDVTLNGQSLILSDIGALGRLNANSRSIQVRSRGRGAFVVFNKKTGQFVLADGNNRDFGTDFVASDLNFRSRPLKFDGQGGKGRSDAIFAVNNPRNLSQTLDRSEIRLLQMEPAFEDFFATSAGVVPRSSFLDVAANGPLAGNLADLGGTAALEQQADDGEVTAGASAPATVLDQLQKFDIPVQRASTSVLIDAQSGYATYRNDSAFLDRLNP